MYCFIPLKYIKAIIKIVEAIPDLMEEANKLSVSLNGYINIYKNHMMTAIRAVDFFNKINSGKNCNEQGCKIDDQKN